MRFRMVCKCRVHFPKLYPCEEINRPSQYKAKSSPLIYYVVYICIYIYIYPYYQSLEDTNTFVHANTRCCISPTTMKIPFHGAIFAWLMVQGPAAFVKCRSSDTEIIVDLGYSVHKGVFNVGLPLLLYIACFWPFRMIQSFFIGWNSLGCGIVK